LSVFAPRTKKAELIVPRSVTPATDRTKQSAKLRTLFRHIRERVPLHDDLVAEIAEHRASRRLARVKHDLQQYVEHWSMMTDQELKYVAEKWVAEYGDRAPSQIRQWAKDQDLETDAPVFFERVASLAERLLADQNAAPRAN
jgi:hypothetical protein